MGRVDERDGEFLVAAEGTYISVDLFHLFRYLDEQCFRFDKRCLTDAELFVIILSQIIGRRLTYDELTGKMDTPVPFRVGASATKQREALFNLCAEASVCVQRGVLVWLRYAFAIVRPIQLLRLSQFSACEP